MILSTIRLFWSLVFLSLIIIFISCKRGPDSQEPFSLEVQTKVVESYEDIRWAEHEVVVKEVHESSNYLYLQVEEGSKTYWIATGPGSVKPGNRYFFNEAVVKRDFTSEKLDRKFDSIYLVTQLLPESRKQELKRMRFNPHDRQADVDSVESMKEGPGTLQVQRVTLKEIFNNPKQFENQVVEVSGICTKINEGIMERNWIHLKPEAAETKEIVATSDSSVGVGETVTLRAMVRLDKDFGAGYVYPILLEDATIIE